MSALFNAQSFATAVAANSQIDPILWQSRVRKMQSQKCIFKEMISSEGSDSPIVEVTDLKAEGAGDTVIMNTYSEERGQGVLGESRMMDSMGTPHPGTFSIAVDIVRNAWAWTQKFRDMTKMGAAKDEVTSTVSGTWSARKMDDDIQATFLRYALLIDTTLVSYVGDRAGLSTLLSTDTLTLNAISDAKGILISRGAKQVNVTKDVSGAEDLQYIFASPNDCLRPMRNNSTYQTILQNADTKSPENRLFTGKYGMWDNMAIYNLNLIFDDAPGRQGSPLAPKARLGTAITDGTTATITGGGFSAEADMALGDFFANFPNFVWKLTTGDSNSATATGPQYLPTQSGTRYVMIYNVPGSTDAGCYEIVAYTTGIDAVGRRISSVTRGVPTSGVGNIAAQAAGRFSFRHDVGSLIFPCTVNGVPYGYSLGLGREALGYARGKWNEQRTKYFDDGEVESTGEAFLQGWGLMSTRGIAPFKNTANRITNFCVVCSAIKVDGIQAPVAYTG